MNIPFRPLLGSLALALALGFAPNVPAQSAAKAAPAGAAAGLQKVVSLEGITEYRLDNGLRVLFVPDPSVDTVTVNMTYLVGSRNEGYGESGMAHLLEHLLFRGTPRFPNIKGELLKRGARFNGTTSNDRTNYYETFNAGADNLDWALALEADRMIHSNVSRQDLDAEMTVVRNEFESGENSPSGVLYKRIAATAYQWHNYGRSTIGARSDIENVSIERLRAFYETYYQPDNAVLLIAGKFDESAAQAMVRKHFGAIPRPGRALPATYTAEPVQDGERSVVLRRVGDVQIVSAFYHLPPGPHPDHAALDILVALLGHTPSGRLHKALVEPGMASSVFGWESQQREAGYAYFGSTLRIGQSIEAARDAIIDTVEGVARLPITVDEFERARTRLLNEIEMTVANSRALALNLTETIAMGDWRLLFLHRDRIREATLAQVQEAAARYFKSSNRTVGMFIPTATPDRAEVPAAPDIAQALRNYQGGSRVTQGESFNPTPENIEARTLRRSLPGGMRLALLPKKTRGNTVFAQLGFRWGDEQSKTGRSVACGIASAMLQRGTKKRTREQLSNEFSRLKASVGVSGEGASIQTVRENLPDAMRLVAEVLRQPTFPDAEFEQLRRASLSSLEAQRSEPASLSGLMLRRHLDPYPPDHWLYNTSLEERMERIRNARLEDVRACYRDLFGASNSELAVVGDFDADEIVRLATELFGDWKSPRQYQRIASLHQDVPAVDRIILTPDKANAVYRAAMSLKLKDENPDYPALLLGNYLLGGGSDSRLSSRIREKEGLSYSVGSYLTASSQDEKGEFGISAIYAPQNRERIEALVKEELHYAFASGFTDNEVNTAKKGYLEARQIARGQDAGLAGRLMSYLVLNRTFEWDRLLEARIAALTAPQILDALRRHIDPARLSLVKAGDFSK
ncbi:MAG: pseudouridine synthase [Betaproteobacteria bacterium RIFCSPLOWO2_02_FULL_62_17]|nr:MAG: pseudouridine synthase [Betaproteobacteria bacterium RIFCSPLOWO2_02_FULL_62_17]